MNIIEAIQKAENGALITNNFLDLNKRFLKYAGNGIFDEYELVNNKAVYLKQVNHFSVAQMVTNEWKVLYIKPFMTTAEDFIKHHFPNIDKQTEWYPALVAVADGYAKYIDKTNNVNNIYNDLQERLNVLDSMSDSLEIHYRKREITLTMLRVQQYLLSNLTIPIEPKVQK